MDETAPGPWPEEWTRRIGRNLAALRAERGVSGRELSERCGTLGHPMPRNVIANLESGRKTSVPVHELAVLAMALGVPPVLLLYDLPGEDVEALPDVTVSPWSAVQWFTGELPLWLGYRWGQDPPLGPSPEEEQRYEAGAAPLIWLRGHDEIAQRVATQQLRVLASLRVADATPEGPGRDAATRYVEFEREHLLKDQEGLQSWRQRMLLAGLRLPPVRPDLLPPQAATTSSDNA